MMVDGEKVQDAPPLPGHSLNEAQLATIVRVLELLETERASVSSVTDPKRAWRVHVADSLTGLEFPQLSEASIIADIGSGAGFPGLVLAVALPRAQVDLIESVGRKCDFIERTIAAAGITNARAINARSEELAAGDGRESYGAVTARAVGRLSTLAELASPLLEDGGVLVAWKGKRDPDEEAQLARASERLAMQPEQTLHVGPYAGSEHRHLHLLRKSGPTPPNLPRRSGMAKKRPYG
ncbi:MAG: rRNA (guanine527-N7)-methyltransferase [Solirubrobacterales bacterium]|jgi:16S rRNA (guanine527-N7)-methyltransferase|nr:rRNA (guanine527-N7)-methyltransferase [Solirubrobacterales bacterium]